VRLFMSHSARHRELVGKVADELAIVGIHGFVAHNTMTYSRPWQAQIEQAPTPITLSRMIFALIN
jgi:hypothetical protein